MRPSRRLVLRLERLAELDPPELARVAAGDLNTTSCATTPLLRCLFVASYDTICSAVVCS